MRVALAVGCLALAALLVPSLGKFLALGLGSFAVGLGLWAYRGSPGGVARLGSAGAMALGLLGASLGGIQIALTGLALSEIARLLG